MSTCSTLFSSTKWGGRVSKSVDRGHGKKSTLSMLHVIHVLGLCFHGSHSSPQPYTDKERPRDDPIRGVSRTQAYYTVHAHIQMCGACQDYEAAYEPGTKAYHMYDPVVQRIHVSRDMVFDERKSWDMSSNTEDAIACTNSSSSTPPQSIMFPQLH
jgi:hypothetical protein